MTGTPEHAASRRPRGLAVLASAVGVTLVAAIVVGAVLLSRDGGGPAAEVGHGAHAGAPHASLGAATADRHSGPQGRVGQFVVKCTYSHSAPDDPIVHPGAPGRSHRHDFYGATTTDASSTAEGLLDGETTCDKRPDTAAYWQPTLFNHGVPVTPTHINAYYRAAPGVDPTTVRPYPLGLELLAGDPTATEPQPGEVAGWVCGSQTAIKDEPPVCSDRAPLHMLLTFPDCWDGERLRSADHRSHAAYSNSGACPDSHPVVLPQLTMAVAFPIGFGDHDLTLASGDVLSAHGDFLNAWDPEGLGREVTACIIRQVVCDLASNRDDDGPFLTQ